MALASVRSAPAREPLSVKKIRADLGLSRDKMGRLLGVTYKTIEA